MTASKLTARATPASRTSQRRLLLPTWLAAMAVVSACGGGSTPAKGSTPDGRVVLQSIEYGRVVDVYAYRRIDTTRGDRRDRLNRQGVLVARNVSINPSIETQQLFDATGDEIPDANFEYRPFDVETGHEELLILWDDRPGPEQQRFNAALALSRSGLAEIPDSYRGQNTGTHPIPVVPRNAALKLKFSAPLTGIDDTFFLNNPSALQLLEFMGDPAVATPGSAFRAVTARILVQGDTIIVDTTILGREGGGGTSTTGMPSSVDNVTANIRLAMPTRGAISQLFYVKEDPVANLNGPDGFGRDSVIRDFRSGNLRDGRYGTLSDAERPMIVGNLDMGIIDIDAANKIVTLNKRFHQVPVRGRLPFVDGTLNPSTGLPTGPAGVPTLTPLRSGDYLVQIVDVRLPDGSVERVRVRAEIMQNMDIVTQQGVANPGRTPSGSQGNTAAIARVKFASLEGGVDSLGRPVSFTANTLPEGADCTLRNLYYEEVRFVDGNGAVSDNAWRNEFLVFDPKPPRLANQQPVPPGTMIDPLASVSIGFSEPMDLERVDPSTNLVISNSTLTAVNFGTLIGEPKPACLSIIPSRLTDQTGDGTRMQLAPQLGLGHFHVQGTTENYFFHVLLNAAGAADLAGNTVQVFDDPRTPTPSWSVSYTLDGTRPNNQILGRLYRFEDVDEDGTPFGSVDAFGQFRIQNGRLMGAETVRFNRQADNQNLGGISRINRGECWQPGTIPPPPAGSLIFPTAPANGGNLYWQPRMYDIQPVPPAVFLPPMTPQDVGRVIEPHQPRGSRMMMRYLEDDFSLDYRRSSEFVIDVEQLYWSPFNDETVLYDVFDRYTMLLSHCDKRPDEHFSLVPAAPPAQPVCRFDCPAVSSSLSATFTDNILRGSSQSVVFEDAVYQVNPNDAFRASTGNKFVPYPRFTRTYTWRDSRLITLDSSNAVTGLGGARDPGNGSQLQHDWTADVDSPWVTSRPDLVLRIIVPGQTGPPVVPPVTRPMSDFPGTTFVLDEADFRGTRRRDLDPIAMPLLVDFMMFPDDARNGISSGTNGFQIAMVGPPSNFPAGNPGGYYNSVPVGCAGRNPWPWTRIHTTGGLDPNTGQNILVDPANSATALGGWIKDAGLGDPIQGLFLAPPGDGHLYWAQADFVRKVSTATFGFFDSLKPNQHALPASLSSTWPTWIIGLTNQAGFPNAEPLQGGALRIRDLVTQMDPPISMQPAGTSVVLEIRGADTFTNPTIYDRNLTAGTPPLNTGDRFDMRGNLLNCNYACEAYRYAQPNAGPNNDLPRIEAHGLTKYVTEDRLNELRNPASGLLPRYLNIRLVMNNNVGVTPAISPSLRSLALVYRLAAQ